MAFISITVHKYISKKNANISKKIGNYICDYCKVEFTGRAKPKIIAQDFHFCSKQCSSFASRKGEVIFEKKKNNYLINYGSAHHFKNKEVQEKRVKTCIEKFGGRAPLCSKKVKDKMNETIQEKFGDHFSRSKSVRDKIKKTCIKKYGVDSFSKTKEFKDSINWQEINKKGFETRKNNGISPVSKIEQKFCFFLKEHFTEVQSQIPVNKWWIDFYIPVNNCYIQFNGDYWHGTSKNYEELINSPHPRDKVIAATKLRDLEKEKYFKENNLNLIIIHEYEFKNKEYQVILDKINKR